MLGDSHSIAAGGVHHHDAALGGSVEIDVVDAYPARPMTRSLGALSIMAASTNVAERTRMASAVASSPGKRFFVGGDDFPVFVLAKDGGTPMTRFCQR